MWNLCAKTGVPLGDRVNQQNLEGPVGPFILLSFSRVNTGGPAQNREGGEIHKLLLQIRGDDPF